MQEGKHHEEIIIRSVRPGSNQWGSKVGISDTKGIWYNSKKKGWTEDEWNRLTGLKEGSRVALDWVVRSYDKPDGTTGYTNDITRFDPIIQRTDEVVPSGHPGSQPTQTATQTAPQNVAHTGPEMSPRIDNRDDMIAKQVCLKAGVELVGAIIGSFEAGTDLVDEVLKRARALYAGLKEPW